MWHRHFVMTLVALTFVMDQPVTAQSSTLPDLRTVEADVSVPEATNGTPAAGQRCFVKLAESRWEIPYVICLPQDWDPSKLWPVFVELPGNGGYRDALGDECSGLPQDCRMGYGFTKGQNWIWVCLPFLNGDGSKTAVQWWGDAPRHDPAATLLYWKAVMADVHTRFSGDQSRVVLAGFSRGAIACNALGLHDDATSSLWTAFLPCSHYDGVRSWPFAASDQETALRRLQRLNGRPQFICGEGTQTEETRKYLSTTGVKLDSLTIVPTGFRNHSDAWTLRPCEARSKARAWLDTIKASR